MRRLARIRELPPSKRRLLLASVASIAFVRVLLCIVPFARARQFLDWAATGRTAASGCDTIADIHWAIHVAGRLVPGGTHCLTMALAAQLLLRRRACVATLHFGVPRDRSVSFVAHAWVVSEGVVVCGGQDVDRRYVELTS